MAYTPTYLSCMIPAQGNAGQALWAYVTTDANAAVVATDYFSNAREAGMSVGDAVLITTKASLPAGVPSDAGLYLVTAIDSDGNGTVVAAVAAA